MGEPGRLASSLSLSVTQALLIIILAAVATVGLCAGAAEIRKKRRSADLSGEAVLPGEAYLEEGRPKPPLSGWEGTKNVLAGALCWSGASAETVSEAAGWWEEAPRPPAGTVAAKSVTAAALGVVGGTSSAVSPVWQRRILMGERCRLPKFSGLILYDERGRPLRGDLQNDTLMPAVHIVQEKPANSVTSTLKDLLI
ncbi:hypothetical protein AXF42_Ash001214 [Apostasia shenzhenica]|uniref:Uncharacterized protein n=1 Tax=Apostasia shenzhenica TaxID=1088818 RepID=A0A2I0AUA2_9ASPA|nr:hypothetical protein AXF42_Ash001214 [Apostasia shenzhenica]